MAQRRVFRGKNRDHRLEPRSHWWAGIRFALPFALWILAASLPCSVKAQESDLILRQTGVAERYQRLEELLLRLADVEAAENPERAALLRRAAKQSRDKFVLQSLRKATDSLKNEKFADAISSQDSAKDGLAEILKLLTSEDRASRLRDEKKRIAEMVKNLKRIERAQRGTRARTENGSDLEELKGEQKSIADRGAKLEDQLDEENEDADSSDESQSNEKGDEDQEDKGSPKSDQESKDSDSKPSSDSPSESEENPGDKQDSKSNDSKPNEDGEPSDGKQQDGGEQKSGEQQSGEQQSGEQQQSQSQQQQGQPSQGQQGEQSASPQSPATPQQEAQQQLQKAIQRMRQAEKQLEESKRDLAVEEQMKAEENLRSAIDQLEQILRQLREEEMQRELARLESRLKKMAEMQSRVLDDTIQLAQTPKPQRDRQTDVKSGELEFLQEQITIEAGRAMLLLREEGSSVAFPEVVTQIRDDSQKIAERLSKTKIDAVTQGIQQDVLAAIEEMIKALQKAQRDLEKQQQEGKGAPQQGGSPGDQPLVDAIAELKLIQTMEKRIKSTTQRYSGLLQSDETSAQDLLPLLKSLSDKQDRLYKITRDLVMERNK